jgi:heptosyltransferase I
MATNTPPSRILVIRLSSIGDILHTLPALQDLRRSFPAARLDWLVERRMSFLLSAFQGIDGIHVVDTSKLKRQPWDPMAWRESAKLVKELRSIRYDVCIDFQGLLKTAFIGFLSGARVRLGFGRELVRERPAHWMYHQRLPETCGNCHITVRNRLLAYQAGARPADDLPAILSRPVDEEFIESRLKTGRIESFIVINPGAGWPTKRWPPDRYGALAARILKDLSIPVIVTTGPGEVGLFEAMARECPVSGLTHLSVDFLKLIPLFRKATAVISGDTGPYHLACAMKVPTVGIFGSTAPERNGPWSNLDESVYRMLPCSFCHGRKCPTRIECMDIPVDAVLAALKRRLERAPAQ